MMISTCSTLLHQTKSGGVHPDSTMIYDQLSVSGQVSRHQPWLGVPLLTDCVVAATLHTCRLPAASFVSFPTLLHGKLNPEFT